MGLLEAQENYISNKHLLTTMQGMTTTFVLHLPLSDPLASPLPLYHLDYYLWIPACLPIDTEKEMKTIFAAISSYVQKDFCFPFHGMLSLFPP